MGNYRQNCLAMSNQAIRNSIDGMSGQHGFHGNMGFILLFVLSHCEGFKATLVAIMDPMYLKQLSLITLALEL
jgi:hypothetical protein